MKPAICISVVLALSTASAAPSGAAVVPVGQQGALVEACAERAATFGWTVREADHICGLKNARQLSSPAVIDFDEVMAATDEIKTLEREGIDRSSPRGQQLVSRATRRVTEAAKIVMGETGHCSIWKSISHSDGRDVPAVTAEVRRNL